MLPAIHRVCPIYLTGERVVIVRVHREGRQLTTDKANEGLVDTDSVEVAPVLGEADGRLRIACATKLVRACELAPGEG